MPNLLCRSGDFRRRLSHQVQGQLQVFSYGCKGGVAAIPIFPPIHGGRLIVNLEPSSPVTVQPLLRVLDDAAKCRQHRCQANARPFHVGQI
jgi:hypothetical protein